jgi:hypothetical protein
LYCIIEVSSWIKPGAKTDELVGRMKNDFKGLEKSDVIVINGGRTMLVQRDLKQLVL